EELRAHLNARARRVLPSQAENEAANEDFAFEESDDDLANFINPNIPSSDVKWKDNLLERASKMFQKTLSLMDLVYKSESFKESDQSNQQLTEDDEFFVVKKKTE